jgi:hypothetical protein
MTEYYANVYREDFQIADFLSQAESLRNGWNSDLQARVSTKVQVMRQRNLDFIERMKNFL